MKLRTYLIASTALFAGSSAFAADLPVVAEPVDYVKACDAFGAGYFQIPGKDTCLKFQGRIRTQVVSGDLLDGDGKDYASYSRAYLWVDSKTAAETFTVSTFMGFVYQWNGDGSETGLWQDDAFVQIGHDNFDLTVGAAPSLFLGFTGYAWMAVGGTQWADYSPLTAILRVPVGDLTFGVALEDSDYTGNEGGTNFIASLDYSHAMFDVRVAGALVDSASNTTKNSMNGDDDDDYGYAVNVNTEIRPSDKLAFTIGAQYGNSVGKMLDVAAGSYGDLFPDSKDDEYEMPSNYFDLHGVDVFTVHGGFRYSLTDTVNVMFEAAYTEFETTELSSNFEGDHFLASTSIVWSPVSGLGIALGAGYNKRNITRADADPTDNHNYAVDNTIDNFKVGTRVQYTF